PLIPRARVSRGGWAGGWASAALEWAWGFTGFFGGSREPLFIAIVVLAEQFDYRRVAHWAAVGVVSAVMAMTGVLWIGIPSPLRPHAAQLSHLTPLPPLDYTSALAQSLASGRTVSTMSPGHNFI